MLSPEVIKRIRDKSRLRNIPEPDIKTIYDALYSGTFRSIAENIKEVTIKETGLTIIYIVFINCTVCRSYFKDRNFRTCIGCVDASTSVYKFKTVRKHPISMVFQE